MIVVVIVVALVVLGVLAFVLLGSAGRAQRKAESNAERILDATFDGRDDVTFALNMRTLKYDTVVLGAKTRGYKLESQASNQYGPTTLVFSKN